MKEKSDKRSIFKNKQQSTMFISIVACVLFCAVLFSVLGVYMSSNSNKTVDRIGETYMMNMGDETAQRFESVMTQRLTMVTALESEYDDEENVAEKMKEAAHIRDFTFLAFYYAADNDTEGYMQPILGQTLELTNKDLFRNSILEGEPKIGIGTGVTEEGETLNRAIIIGIPTEKYTMTEGEASGKKCKALIAGVSNKDLVDMLNINSSDHGDEEGVPLTSYIIDKNGRFVISDRSCDTYYEHLKIEYGETKNVEGLIASLDKAVSNNEIYTDIVHLQSTGTGQNKSLHFYCKKLAYTEWFLITEMENGELDRMVAALSTQWTAMIVFTIAVVIALLVVLFVIYMRFNHNTMDKLEAARVEALEASKAKSEFLSNMSHDIRTPMNAIVGMTAIARSHIDNQEQVQECLKKIALSSKHLLGLINDVLDMSKIESGKMTLNMEQISLREVLDGITTIVQPQLKIKKQNFNVLIRDVSNENVYCDSVRLNQVLLNLLSNAIKFTQDEGTISVYLNQEPSPIGDRYIRTHIRVKDNGIGMSAEFQKKVFESFTREDKSRIHKTEGTGLGMSITKYIIDAMHGTIDLQSETGKGTEFHVTLDLEIAEIEEENMLLPPWKMLVVDDDQTLCETTVAALKDIGIDGEWSLDGETAIEKAVKAHDSGRGYDIILLDWKLPGIDGIKTAQEIRNRLNEEIPILLISAYDWSEIEQDAKAAGICGFLNKPLFKSTLFYGLKQFTDTASKQTLTSAEESKNELDGIKVLLAEDNELNWEITETLLDSIGIVCDHAENGQICVDMLKSSAPGTYKAILMDIRMPVMTGYEATEAIRKLDHPDKDLPIIAMTADAFADDMKKCLDCGMNAHIAKPIDIDIVQATLIKFLNK